MGLAVSPDALAQRRVFHLYHSPRGSKGQVLWLCMMFTETVRILVPPHPVPDGLTELTVLLAHGIIKRRDIDRNVLYLLDLQMRDCNKTMMEGGEFNWLPLH